MLQRATILCLCILDFLTFFYATHLTRGKWHSCSSSCAAEHRSEEPLAPGQDVSDCRHHQKDQRWLWTSPEGGGLRSRTLHGRFRMVLIRMPKKQSNNYCGIHTPLLTLPVAPHCQVHAGTLRPASYLRPLWESWPPPCLCCMSELHLQRSRSWRTPTPAQYTAPSSGGPRTCGPSTSRPDSQLPGGP